MSHSTFVVAQGRIVKARVYDIRSPNGLGRMPLTRLVFEVPGQRPGQAQYYLPVIVQGETAMEVQAFLEASDGTPSEAIAQGNLVIHKSCGQ